MSLQEQSRTDVETRASVETKLRAWHPTHNFARRLNFSAEMHWFFSDAAISLSNERFLASVLCAFHGIEATVRWLHLELKPSTQPDLADVTNMNHSMLRNLKTAGYRVEALSFPGEVDFLNKIKQKKPYVELVRQRNNLAHGNVVEYFQDDAETGDRLFNPEYLRGLAGTLAGICDAWTLEIERCRNAMQGGPASVAAGAPASPASSGPAV